MMKAMAALALLGALWSASASAACMQDRWGQVICGAGQCTRDREGEVYCAPTRFGSAVRTSDGQVKCAPGQCVRNLRGEVICSDIDGGGAVKLMDGTARCEGACVQATTELCEYTPAGR